MPPDDVPEVLWTPDPIRWAMSRLAAFNAWLGAEHGVDLPDYNTTWRWSVTELEEFWGAVAEFFDVEFHNQPETVLRERTMPGSQWFPGATLNYAEHALRPTRGKG
ncbi:MAG TPA: acetyl-coenzyme A synthetase N-terminal domain-containing protein, partial [Jiangellaceae bacterium]|nr:acetyl-coenzyme A synthetase N-terminal domain-containing protein [Jiangellaceae bacterium]